MEPKVAMKIREGGPGARIIDIEGEVTAFAEGALADAFSEAASDDTKAVILNLAGLEYMNSGGIGLLVTILIRANRMGKKLMAYGLNDHYKEIFALTRLDEAIGIFEDETAVRAAV